jgi:8-oxo-dGTP pyrophosphatase MutT (NUDIX family)
MKSACCVLIPRDGKYLAVSRRWNDKAWGMPGGKVDDEETFFGAACRELFEETGVRASNASLLAFYEGTSAGDNDFCVTTYLWIDKPISDEILIAEDGLRLTWLTEEELSDPKISPFAVYNRCVFAALKERYGS